MKRRRSSIATDSFDLLLDTITNTFGGVLLIALLLVLLIRESGSSDTPNSRPTGATAEQAETLANRIGELTSRREMLVRTIDMQQKLDENFGNPDAKRLANDLSKLLQQQQQLQKTEGDAAQKAKSLASEIEGISSQVDATLKDLVALAADLSTVEGELKHEQDLRTRTMDLPREQPTSKRLAVVILKGNELFLPNKSGNGGFGLVFELNREHFDECARADADIVFASGKAAKIRPGAGLEMKAEILEQHLSQFDRDREFLTIVVVPDSFGSFATLRDACVKLGLEHRILAVEATPVFESSGTGPAKAQ